MSKKLIAVFLIAGFVASPVFADAAYNAGPTSVNSSLTRAEVKAELARAQQTNEIAFSHTQYPALQHEMHAAGDAMVSRAEVKAEFLRAWAANEIAHDFNS